jgi:hypothetical protein
LTGRIKNTRVHLSANRWKLCKFSEELCKLSGLINFSKTMVYNYMHQDSQCGINADIIKRLSFSGTGTISIDSGSIDLVCFEKG